MKLSKSKVAAPTADYGNSKYWEERYSTANSSNDVDGEKDAFFDWYQDYSTLKQHLVPYLQLVGRKMGSSSSSKDIEILIPGCGISTVSQMMRMQNTVRSSMGGEHSGDDIDYAVMDALDMPSIPDSCFDLIIDKGLLDTQLCSESNIDDVTALVKEMYRVLAPGGVYLVISHGGPGARLRYLFPPSAPTPSSYGLEWTVDYLPMLKPEFAPSRQPNTSRDPPPPPSADPAKNHFMYVCKKR